MDVVVRAAEELRQWFKSDARAEQYYYIAELVLGKTSLNWAEHHYTGPHKLRLALDAAAGFFKRRLLTTTTTESSGTTQYILSYVLSIGSAVLARHTRRHQQYYSAA